MKVPVSTRPNTITKHAYGDGTFEYIADYSIQFSGGVLINIKVNEFLQEEKNTIQIKELFAERINKCLSELIESPWE